MHGLEGGGGGVDLLEDDKGLASHLQVLQGDDVHDLTKLGEDCVKRFLQF